MPKIPLSLPEIGIEEKKAVIDVLESGWLTHGKFNTKLEEKFAEYIGVKEAITLNSCTSALELALKSNNITGEVIIPSFTFVATANAVINAGATPVFCDVDTKTRNVNRSFIEPLINSKTEAVIVVHFGGQTCPMDDIVQICQKNNLLLIEDSAETIGGKWKDKRTGSFGIGCFSFFPTKNMTTGEGGIVTCNDSSLSQKIRALSAHGISPSMFGEIKKKRPWFRSAILPGHNYRMSNILAAIGLCQLRKVDSMNKKRQALASYYNKGIKNANLPISTPFVLQSTEHVYQMYTVQTEEGYRDNLVIFLRKNGIEASVHFDPPVHLQQFYKDYIKKKTPLPNTEYLSKTIITLPMHSHLTHLQIDQIIQTIIFFFKNRL